jgi:hypothetical protein
MDCWASQFRLSWAASFVGFAKSHRDCHGLSLFVASVHTEIIETIARSLLDSSTNELRNGNSSSQKVFHVVEKSTKLPDVRTASYRELDLLVTSPLVKTLSSRRDVSEKPGSNLKSILLEF